VDEKDWKFGRRSGFYRKVLIRVLSGDWTLYENLVTPTVIGISENSITVGVTNFTNFRRHRNSLSILK